MSKGDCNCSTPSRTPVRKDWEIEAKVSLDRPIELDRNVVYSEHRFFYDDCDVYLFSVTDDRKFKQKTETIEVVVNGIHVLARNELMSDMPDHLPKAAGFRMVERRRQGLNVGGCFVSFDEVTCNGSHLYQLEAEFLQSVDSFKAGMQAMAECARVMHTVISTLERDVRVTFRSPAKYDWARLATPRLPMIREGNTWMQRLSGL